MAMLEASDSHTLDAPSAQDDGCIARSVEPLSTRRHRWRKTVVRGTLTFRLVVLLLALVGMASVRAADPLPESPGWYRAQIGQLTVTALWDGAMDFPVDKMFPRVGRAALKALLARSSLSPTVKMSVNAFVIDTGQRIVMIDTGNGASPMFGAGLGKLQSNLRAAGYTPEQIDEIYLTHLHTDHVGGLTVEGRAVYPRAIVRAEAREAGHYLSREKMAAAHGDQEDFASAMAMLAPYVESGRFRPFEGPSELAAGVHAVPAWGHTPGHTVYVVESEGEKLVMWGDVMHVAAVEFLLPGAEMAYEASAAESLASRRRVFREVARDGAWVAAAHVGFPGIGKLRADGAGGYAWVPMTMVRGR